MRKIASFLALSWAVLFVSCEEETLDPRTNPRFSVTIIQEISASGVQLGADIYDFGDEEILEYGFVYTQSNGSPSLNQDDYVSKQGRPESSFELIANHSMALGKKYYVSAFLRTPTSLVFSKSMEFISQGSEGFIVNSIEWPELIYKSQNLVVKGRRFSKQRDNYKVKLGQFDLYPNLVDSTMILLPLPEGLLTQTTGQDIEIELRIEISEKVYTEKRVLKFQEPVFDKQDPKRIIFDQEVIIKGDFLDQGIAQVKIGNILKDGLNAKKNEINFTLSRSDIKSPTQSDPEVSVIVRGLTYNLGKIYYFDAPKITSDKIILNKNTQLIPIENFYSEDIFLNQFFDEGGSRIDFTIRDYSDKGITVEVFGTTFKDRNFKMRVSSFGILSNLVDVEVSLPVVNIDVGSRNFPYTSQDLALISGEKVIVLTNDGVIIESPAQKFQQEKIAEIPIDLTSRFLGVRQAVLGGFVFGGGRTYLGDQYFQDLYYFSLEKMVWEQLPNLPESINGFNRVVSKGGLLIFEDATIDYQTNVGEKWSFNLQSKTWERISASNLNFRDFQTFYFGGETYLHGREYSSTTSAIFKLKADFTWEKVIDTPSLTQSSMFATPLVKQGKYYVFSGTRYSIIEIDLNTKQIKEYPYPYSYEGRIPIPYSKGVYMLPANRVLSDIRFEFF